MQTAPRADPGHCVCSGFVPVPLCGKRTRAGWPGEAGVAAGCVSRAGLQGRCGSGNLQCARPGLRSWSQRLPEAEKTRRPDCTWGSPPSPPPLFLGSPQVHSLSLSLPPSYLSVLSSIPIFTLTAAIAGSWLQGWSMCLLTTRWLVVFHRCAHLPGARNLLAVCLRDPPVAVGKRFGKVSFSSIPSLGKVPLERRMELL